MTEEEIEKEAKEYSQGNFYSEQGFLYGYERGSAESRKEVRLYETTCINRLHHIEKENEELKARVEQLSNDNHVLKTSFIMQQGQIEKMKCCGNCDNNAYCDKEHYGNDKGCKDWELAE